MPFVLTSIPGLFTRPYSCALQLRKHTQDIFTPYAVPGLILEPAVGSNRTAQISCYKSCYAEILLTDANEKMTVDELVKALKPRGRMTVPDNIKAELLSKLRAAIVS